MAKTVTVSAKLTVEEKKRVEQIAEENNLTINALIKQLLVTGKVVDVKQIRSLKRARLEELNKISNYLYEIMRYCGTHKGIDREVLLSLVRIEDACKNI